uniref:Uncharacterized protein LOC114343819 n=1 Tax=Diabrotica virgifera virgifera TaxID=50390 RepID=A0A6P7GKM5_DIAVI
MVDLYNMEFNIEIEEKFIKHDQRYIHPQLSTSTDFVDLKNEPEEDKSAMELQLKIKEEFVEGSHSYIEDQLFTSLDHKEFKNEPEADSSGKTNKKVYYSASKKIFIK